MKRLTYLAGLFMLTVFLFQVSAFAQQGMRVQQDSLTEISVTGIVEVDSSYYSDKYLLDVDGDDIADYILNFGPKWYQPDSSDAVRPASGDQVSIYGGINEDANCIIDSLPVIIVYEINDEYWRDPFEPFWLSAPGGKGGHGYGQGNHHGYASGWQSDSLEIVEIQGTTMIDTTFNYWHYYLDTDADTIPDYFLNFGPPWYEPETNISKPADGELITVLGALKDGVYYPVILVFELNGEVWRDSTALDGRQLGGQWIHKNMLQNRFIHTPFDTASGLEVRTGWKGDKSPGTPDSLYCQMLQLFPQNIGSAHGQNAFAGFEVGVFNRNRQNLMVCNDSTGGALKFESQVRYRFHYNDIQAQGYNINENTIQIKVWNRDRISWENIDDVLLDTEANMVSFESETVSSLFILTAEQNATAIADEKPSVVSGFTLKQNYPNPFNPLTTIEFNLVKDARVVLTVYNVLGQKIVELADVKMQAGNNKIVFNAEGFSSGIYFYELKAGNSSKVMKMTLIE